MTLNSHIGLNTIQSSIDDQLFVQNKIVLLLNRAAFLTFIGAFTMASISCLVMTNPIYSCFAFGISVLYLVIPVLHYFKKPHWTQVYIAFVLCNWVYVFTVLTGTFFSQSAGSMITIILGYFFFQNKKRLQILCIAYNCSMFFLATTYVSFYPAIIEVPEVPFDEVGVYIIGLSWIYVIFSVYEMEKEKLIYSLKHKNEILEETTEELERFTHIASHDLKSPLRTIISFLGLIERDIKKGNFENITPNLEFAKSGAHQLNYLIEDVLEFSLVKANKYQETAIVDMTRILAKVKLNLNADIQAKNAKIVATDLPTCQCNETEFILVFQNLLHNGIKYNKHPEPIINVWSEHTENGYLIHFQDNGIGIEEKYFDKIFEHFKRLHTANEYPGTGLGLSLCKKIIEKYNGSIQVKSNVDEGSIFTICLPNQMVEIQVQERELCDVG